MIMSVKHISKCGFFQRTHVADTEIKKNNQLINGAAGFLALPSLKKSKVGGLQSYNAIHIVKTVYIYFEAKVALGLDFISPYRL